MYVMHLDRTGFRLRDIPASQNRDRQLPTYFPAGVSVFGCSKFGVNETYVSRIAHPHESALNLS